MTINGENLVKIDKNFGKLRWNLLKIDQKWRKKYLRAGENWLNMWSKLLKKIESAVKICQKYVKSEAN